MSSQSEHDLVRKTTDFLAKAEWLVAGKNFFVELAGFLASVLSVECVSIDKLVDDGTAAESQVVIVDGQLVENFRYSLLNTPCGDVIRNSVLCFASGIRSMFPGNAVLESIKAESYAGVTLWDFAGKPIGLIAVVGRKPMPNPELAESILKIVGIRASGEFERGKNEADLRIKQFVIDKMSDAAIWIRKDGRVTYMNESALMMLGYKAEEVPQITVSDFTIDTTPESWKERWEFLKKAESAKFERLYRRKNGEIFPVEISINYFELNGDARLFGIIRDISLQKEREQRLKESEEKFSKAFHNSPDVIMITSVENGRILDVNHSIYRFGYQKDEIIGKTTIELNLWIDIQDRHRLIHQLEENGQVLNFETQFRTSQGDSFFGLISSEFIEINGTRVILSLIHNIQELKQKEKLLQESEQRLQDMNATKDRFFSLIAHDLRSPFNSIIGFSDLLVDQMKSRDYIEIEKYAAIIYKSAHRVMGLLNNLLDWSKTQTGKIKMNPEYFELNSLVNEVIDLLSETAAQKSIEQKNNLPANLVVCADKEMIHTVLRNLLSNAIKFSSKGGEVVINGTEKPRETLIAVKDTGIGINTENIAKLFRIDQSFSTTGTGNEAGSGLGLIICREFIEKHGGRISVVSEPGKGSEFFFSLPN